MVSAAEPFYGRRLLPSVLDDQARTNPRRLYAVIPKTADVAQGFDEISIADLARCVDFMARWIEDRFGRSDRFETLTYIGLSDLRGPVMFFAAVKCGYKLLLPSPRNPPSTNISLMNQTDSTTLLYTAEMSGIVKRTQEQGGALLTQTIPSFQEMMKSNPVQFPYLKTFDTARDDPIVVVHSSGSTGIPKPITMTHGTFATIDNQMNIPVPHGREPKDSRKWKFEGESRAYTMFPFFHLGGFIFLIVTAIFREVSPVLGPPNLVPDGRLLKSVMLRQKLRAMFVVPSVVEQLLQEPDSISLIKDLELLACSGAPSSPAMGERLSKVVDLDSPYGTTEITTMPELALPHEDWEWREFNPYYKHELQAYDSADGRVYELVLIVDESMKDHMPLYHNLPGISEYRTKDLFLQHPERPTLYKYYGRRDDIIVLANGEKFNPVPFELALQGHPSIQGALVTGNERVQPALILELKDRTGTADQSNMLQDIWPAIEEANSLLPGQGRVDHAKVMFALPEKPMTRTPKGTIMRKLTEKAYQSGIEELYAKSSARGALLNVGLKPILKQVYERSAVVEFLRGVLARSFPHAANIGEDEDLYAHGLDSVQVLEITSNLKRNLQAEAQASKSVSWISARTIYRNPTLAELSRLLVGFLNQGIIPEEDHEIVAAQLLDDTVALYAEGLPTRSAPPITAPAETSKVALIGTTGYLGPYVVTQLLKNPGISHVYCLNRRAGVQQAQRASLLAVDASIEPLLHKLAYMVVKLGEPRLGLVKGDYDLLAREVDVIVYNSWKLDFGISIKSFGPFLQATAHLIDLSTESSRNMRIVFVSSVSSVGAMAAKGTVPEAPVEDALAALDMGYGQSKLAAERILTLANRQCRVLVTIARVCQTGGPLDGGGWPEQPWIAALLRTAKGLGCVPDDLAPIDWVPVDTVSAMLSAFILHPAQDTPQFFNIYPQNFVPWRAVVDFLKESSGVEKTVPMREWTRKLRDIPNPTVEDISKMPALKILDYFEGMGRGGGKTMGFATDRAQTVSGIDIPTVDQKLLRAWLSSWNI
ncbi:acetyl-CoA synthetase-like protein [Hypoxylon sp. FL1284]|nr:acetyl-CoA synthetase-like protein [Hypoxylon sp. FL1284]